MKEYARMQKLSSKFGSTRLKKVSTTTSDRDVVCDETRRKKKSGGKDETKIKRGEKGIG